MDHVPSCYLLQMDLSYKNVEKNTSVGLRN